MRKLLVSICYTMALSSIAVAERTVDYVQDVKPILSNSCYTCHGPDEATREAELRLDSREVALTKAILPGAPDRSELIARITSADPSDRMPPADSRRPVLTEDQVSLLRRWIEQGANYQQHWAYVRPTRPIPPQIADDTWSRNPIDRFVLARLEREQLEPSAEADSRTLVRRLHFDLLGMPPSPESTTLPSHPVLRDSTYDRLVDQLLASPHFGERMAMYWLDVARYADSVGIHGDQENSMSPYRDYVIRAFNQNMPYDRFLTEQIAGDLLPEATLDQKIASAFNRLHMITSEGGAQPKEYLAIYDADRVRNMSSALLGTTMGCTQCHDHKFDPFTSKEFYQLASFFADLKEAGVYGGSKWFPQLEVPTPQQQQSLAEAEKRIADSQQAIVDTAPEDDPARKKLEELQKKRDEIRRTIPTVIISQSVEPRVMRVLPRGNWLDDSGEIVEPAFPATLKLGRLETQTAARLTRMDLANWLVHPDHPLVARVFVNRLWKLVMGEGLVASLDDFGSQGAVPSHPQLLDWLAVEFMESGWDVKHMFRLIVTSKTYQQSSRASDLLRQRDPTNRLLARQNRFRLDAEMIRDNALAISGLMVDQLGGPGVRPYQPAGYYAHLNFPQRTYQPSNGAGLYRRGVYTHWQRTFLHPSLLAFDAPSREECTVKRPRSNTPLQSLVLLNDPIYSEAARVFAQRIISKGGDDVRSRLVYTFQQALQREPTNEEIQLLTGVYRKHRGRYARNHETAAELNKNGAYRADPLIDDAELGAWMSVARIVLALHETITRY